MLDLVDLLIVQTLYQMMQYIQEDLVHDDFDECVQQLLQQSTIDKTLTFQNKTAMQWSQPNERASGWEYFEEHINKEGRQKILQLFSF